MAAKGIGPQRSMVASGEHLTPDRLDKKPLR